MATEEMTGKVQTIEVEAEKMLEKARNKANEIRRKANEEASKVLSAEMPLDDVKAECQQVIQKAKKEADKAVEESKKKADQVKTASDKEVDKIVKRIVNIIAGA